jgi:hydrocephalus-inducing protein
MIICRGIGLEPQVIIGQMHGDIFEPTTSIVFNPILTHSQGDEQEIVIRNPCTFPVEIYNLEFDKQYLEEEKVSFLFQINFFFHVLFLDSSTVTRL